MQTTANDDPGCQAGRDAALACSAGFTSIVIIIIMISNNHNIIIIIIRSGAFAFCVP